MSKHLSKLLLSVVSVLLIVVATIVPTFAASYIQDGDWKYEMSGVISSEYHIESYLGNSSRVQIPALFQSKPVTKVNSEAFLNNIDINYIAFPATIKEIGNNAFYGCTALKSLIIPNTIETIGNNAFYGCTTLSLVSFDANTGVDVIPRNCFNGCTSLNTVILAQGVERIESMAFLGCTNLTSATIPASVTYIADNAFNKCENLTIYGWENTYAQTYAEEKGIEFYSYGAYVEPTTATEPATTIAPVTTTAVTTTETTADTTVETTSTAPATSIATDPVEPSTTTDPTETSVITDPSESTVATTAEVTETITATHSTTVTITDPVESSTSSNKKPYIIGDSDLDEKITVKDATLIQKFIVDLEYLDHVQKLLSNCDAVGEITVKDATLVQKYCAGFENILFVGTEVLV